MSSTMLTIIVISYNTKQMTLECLASIEEQTHRYPFEVLVYDNDSQDGSAEAIAETFPNVKLTASSDNIGFARANNKLIETVDTEYVLLLNPDTVVLDGAIDALMDFAIQNPAAGIWGGKTLFGDKSLNPGSCFKRMTPWNQFCRAIGLAAIFKNSEFFNSENYGGWQRDSVRKVDIVCGCFLLTTTAIWRQLNGFNMKYFMYAEEADLCLRAIKLGYEPVVTPTAVIVHYGGGSEKIRSDKMVRLLRAKISLANDHWPSWQKPLASYLILAWVLTRLVTFLTLCALPMKKKQKWQDSLQAWNDIWKRSREWRFGYQISE